MPGARSLFIARPVLYLARWADTGRADYRTALASKAGVVD